MHSMWNEWGTVKYWKKQGNNNYNNNRNNNYGNQNKDPNNNWNNNNNQKKWSVKEVFTNIWAMTTKEQEKFADLTLSQGFELDSEETTAKIQDF